MTNREQLIQKLEKAPDDVVQKTLDFLNQIQARHNVHPLEEFIGMISDEEAEEMISAINLNCRQVDPIEKG